MPSMAMSVADTETENNGIKIQNTEVSLKGNT